MDSLKPSGKTPAGYKRRELLRYGGGLICGLALAPSALLTACQSNPARSQDETWSTLDALYRHLLPTDDQGPDWREVGTLDYLRANIGFFEPERRDFLLGKTGELNALASTRYGRRFGSLAAAERESLLRQLSANSDWRGWLARHLDIVFDSLLADPIYGGNIEQAGWRWLAHQPGFPTPPADKRWFYLRDRQYFAPPRKRLANG